MLEAIIKERGYLCASLVGAVLAYLTLWLVVPAFRPLTIYTQILLSAGLGALTAMLGDYSAYKARYPIILMGFLERIAPLYATTTVAILATACRIILGTAQSRTTDALIVAIAYIATAFYNFCHLIKPAVLAKEKELEDQQRQQQNEENNNNQIPHN